MFGWFKRRRVGATAFRLAPEANVVGTFCLAEVTVPPRRLVEVFGPPGEGDGYQASGCYVFADAAGNVFRVYDWKATSLFDHDEGVVAPPPDEYWAGRGPDTLHVGGRRGAGDVAAFRRWLLGRLG